MMTTPSLWVGRGHGPEGRLDVIRAVPHCWEGALLRPLHDIAIANIVLCMAYTGGVGEASYIAH